MPLELVGRRARPILRRFDLSIRACELEGRAESQGSATRPRVAEPPADPGPLAGPLWLVAVEEGGFHGHRAGPDSGQRDGPFQDLAPMMIGGKGERGPVHGVVAAKGDEALPRPD